MRSASYARYSSDLQRPSSNEDQNRGFREFVARKGNGWTLLDRYVAADEEASGDSLHESPGRQFLLAEAKKKPRPFDCLLVEDTSRLARNLSDALRFIDTFKYYGVNVISLTQDIDTRSRTPDRSSRCTA
jgi:DNA invertase Pin-like site-specific DNA recombinase